MKKVKLFVFVFIVFLTSAFIFYKAGDWTAKEDYIIKLRFGRYIFGVDSMPPPNYGTLKGLKAVISFDKDNLKDSKIKASVESSSINLGNPSKNSSASGPDVLNAYKFPLVTFESTSIQKVKNGYEATGILTIKDISKQINFPFIFENEIFNGGFTIETKDYNFTHPHVPKEVSIFFTIPVTK
jgi:polyisoprenoid-binding protein YceI